MKSSGNISRFTPAAVSFQRKLIQLLLIISAILFFAALPSSSQENPWRPVVHNETGKFHAIAKYKGGRLDAMDTPQGVFYALYLHGTHRQMGEQYGALTAKHLEEERSIFDAMATEVPNLNSTTLAFFVKRIWAMMRPYTPKKFIEEIDAASTSAGEAGVKDAGAILRSAIVISNISDGYDFEKLFGFKLGARPEERRFHETCSFFAAWGKRTEGGKLYASRDLDWNRDIGINNLKVITIYDPVEQNGKPLHSYATIGYIGLPGALAGINDTGIAVGEIGALNTNESLHGTPWTLLLRDVLERAGSLEQALNVFKEHKNTIGYNFMIADGDAENHGTKKWHPSAVAIETSSKSTAVFNADDPAERDARAIGPDGKLIISDGWPVMYGLPLSEAVFRGDSALSPDVRRTQVADNGPAYPGNDGMPFAGSYLDRYKFQHDLLQAIETGDEFRDPRDNNVLTPRGAARKIGPDETILTAASAADRGSDIMSVAYAATDLDFWVAFESGTGDSWTPAPMNGYYHFNLKELLHRYRDK